MWLRILRVMLVLRVLHHACRRFIGKLSMAVRGQIWYCVLADWCFWSSTVGVSRCCWLIDAKAVVKD